MDGQLDEETKKHRAEIIMQQQYEIFDRKQNEKIGREFTVLVDGYDENDMLYYGRTYMDCAEIDSRVILSTENELLPENLSKQGLSARTTAIWLPRLRNKVCLCHAKADNFC